MTVDEAFAQACAEIDARIAEAIDCGMELLVSKGAAAAEVESIIAWYLQQLDVERKAAIAKLKAVTEGWIARDGATLH